MEFLSGVDQDAAIRAKARFQCFDRYGADTMAYAYAVGGWERWWCWCGEAAGGTLGGCMRHCRNLSPAAASEHASQAWAWPGVQVGVGGAPSCANAALSVLKEVGRKADAYRQAGTARPGAHLPLHCAAWEPTSRLALHLLQPLCPCHTPPCSQKLDGEYGEEAAFAARCNAAVVKGAEGYYRNLCAASARPARLLASHIRRPVHAPHTPPNRRRQPPPH